MTAMTKTTTPTRRWVDIGASGNFADGDAHTFTVSGTNLAVCRAKGQLYAVMDVCSHDDGPLGEGELDGYAIQCPRHGARFDVRTGAVMSMPAIVPIETFPVMEKDGRVLVGLSEQSDTPVDDNW